MGYDATKDKADKVLALLLFYAFVIFKAKACAPRYNR